MHLNVPRDYQDFGNLNLSSATGFLNQYGIGQNNMMPGPQSFMQHNNYHQHHHSMQQMPTTHVHVKEEFIPAPPIAPELQILADLLKQRPDILQNLINPPEQQQPHPPSVIYVPRIIPVTRTIRVPGNQPVQYDNSCPQVSSSMTQKQGSKGSYYNQIASHDQPTMIEHNARIETMQPTNQHVVVQAAPIQHFQMTCTGVKGVKGNSPEDAKPSLYQSALDYARTKGNPRGKTGKYSTDL